MTAPLTPPDCDLRGLSYMPLDVQRLRDSDLALISTGDEFKAAVLLWCVAWSQVPAASIPDDDRLLAALVRLDAKAWKKVRGVALRGWIKCDDGRLYHPVVAEKACDAWKDRTNYRAKREKDRNRLEAWREAQKQSSEHIGNGDETPDETRFETRCETLPEEKGTGSEGIIEPPKPPEGAFSPSDFDQAWDAFPEDGRATTNREQSLAAWVPVAADVGSPALLAAVRAFAASPVAIGPKAKTVPSFALWLRNRRFEAFLGSSVTPASQAPIVWNGPDAVWAACVAAMGEPLTRSYLGRCTWQEVPSPAVIAPSPFVRDKLATARLSVEIQTRKEVA